MKKLFTLIALMAVFMSAKAVHIVDAKVDFSEATSVKFWSWGSASAQERLSIQDGCLHFHSDEPTDPSWDCQFVPIGADNVEIGQVYTLKLKMKGDHAQNISAVSFGGSENWGNLAVPTEWTEIEITYEATKTDGGVLIQCGDYVGDWDIAWMEISHEGVEERPVQWAELLVNGDAEKSWEELGLANVAFDDMENNYKVCFWSKEKGHNMNADGGWDPFPAEIVTEADGNHAFICRAQTADTEGDASAWDNQIWFESPREWKTGEQFKLSFRYKASEPVTTNTQVHHQKPSDYLFYQAIGDINFTTEWQTFEKEVTVSSDANGMWSIAFNLSPNVKTPVDFYIDDLSWSEMVLEHGLFVASTNTETGLVDYDYDNATEFTWDDDMEAMAATVGTAGKQESWVNEVQISTVRGNRRQFLANTLKTKGAVTAYNEADDNWVDYEDGASYKIKLPAQGVWTIYVDTDAKIMAFEQVEGDTPKAPIEIVPNPTVNVVEGQERDWLSPDGNGNAREAEIGTGEAWDNQFWIFANRTIAAGEEVVIEFDYVATQEAKTTTQIHGLVNGGTEYLHWQAIGDVAFTPEEQHFSQTLAWPADGAKTSVDKGTVTNHGIAFNMAEIKEACTYTIKNVIFKTSDDTESLIDMEGDKNFWFKVGAGTAPYSSGINDVVNNKVANNAIYNIAGQRVAENYKGIVVKNGRKFLNK